MSICSETPNLEGPQPTNNERSSSLSFPRTELMQSRVERILMCKIDNLLHKPDSNLVLVERSAKSVKYDLLAAQNSLPNVLFKFS